ncbi:hypothetical protein ACFL0X_01835 [Nanoarchaeota archaeon]
MADEDFEEKVTGLAELIERVREETDLRLELPCKRVERLMGEGEINPRILEAYIDFFLDRVWISKKAKGMFDRLVDYYEYVDSTAAESYRESCREL